MAAEKKRTPRLVRKPKQERLSAYMRLVELQNMAYLDYLQTPEWKHRRMLAYKRAGHRCQVCNSPEKPLHCHHRDYSRRGQERNTDLTVLCGACHALFHKYGRIASPAPGSPT